MIMILVPSFLPPSLSSFLPCSFVLKIGSPYVAQAGLKLMTLLPLSPMCGDYRHVPPCLDVILKPKQNIKTPNLRF
jgi:hypothetical protein